MTNTAWYASLAAIYVFISVIAIYKGRHKYKVSTLIMFYLFTTCITWIGEFIVLGVFDSYAYKPGISRDPWLENLAGHLFLNASMFPAAAIVSITYTLGYPGYAFIIVSFVIAEYAFVHLGIYEQHWWRYYMSAINTAVFLIISRKWFAKIIPPKRNFPRLITLYFVGFLLIHTPSPFLLLLDKQYYRLDIVNRLVGNLNRASIIFIFCYQLVTAALMVYFVCVLDKWYWKLIPFAIIIAGQCFFYLMDILVIQAGWKLVYTILLYMIGPAIFILLEKYTLRPD